MAAIDVQIGCDVAGLPQIEQLTLWCNRALNANKPDAEIALRIVDKIEIQTLNKQFRGKDCPTNVLSFPVELPECLANTELTLQELGDIIICAEVVAEEALEQNKSAEAHWAHMIVHGTLHLQGYDHVEDDDAEEMEALETQIITALGYPEPYKIL